MMVSYDFTKFLFSFFFRQICHSLFSIIPSLSHIFRYASTGVTFPQINFCLFSTSQLLLPKLFSHLSYFWLICSISSFLTLPDYLKIIYVCCSRTFLFINNIIWAIILADWFPGILEEVEVHKGRWFKFHGIETFAFKWTKMKRLSNWMNIFTVTLLT